MWKIVQKFSSKNKCFLKTIFDKQFRLRTTLTADNARCDNVRCSNACCSKRSKVKRRFEIREGLGRERGQKPPGKAPEKETGEAVFLKPRLQTASLFETNECTLAGWSWFWPKHEKHGLLKFVTISSTWSYEALSLYLDKPATCRHRPPNTTADG